MGKLVYLTQVSDVAPGLLVSGLKSMVPRDPRSPLSLQSLLQSETAPGVF
jgi:hypothetical protein